MAETIISGAILSLIVELAKMCGLPKGWEKTLVFVIALLAGALLYYNKSWFDIVVNTLGMAAIAVGTYEVGIKPGRSLVE